MKAELARRESTDLVAEFHFWPKMKNQILTNSLEKLYRLRVVISQGWDHISRFSTRAAVRALYPKDIKLEYEEGIRWS